MNGILYLYRESIKERRYRPVSLTKRDILLCRNSFVTRCGYLPEYVVFREDEVVADISISGMECIPVSGYIQRFHILLGPVVVERKPVRLVKRSPVS